MLKRFALHASLQADTHFVADWALSRVLLMNDARFPWLVLVPRRAGLQELHDLPHAERMVLIEEVVRAGTKLKGMIAADKINTGALGNLVTQLHVHVVARYKQDAAWPHPVWGNGAPQPYTEAEQQKLVRKLRLSL